MVTRQEVIRKVQRGEISPREVYFTRTGIEIRKYPEKYRRVVGGKVTIPPSVPERAREEELSAKEAEKVMKKIEKLPTAKEVAKETAEKEVKAKAAKIHSTIVRNRSFFCFIFCNFLLFSLQD